MQAKELFPCMMHHETFQSNLKWKRGVKILSVFSRYECLKDAFCTLFCILEMSYRSILYIMNTNCTRLFFYPIIHVMNVLKMSFVRYECLIDDSFKLWISQRRLCNVMDVLKMSFVRYECFN